MIHRLRDMIGSFMTAVTDDRGRWVRAVPLPWNCSKGLDFHGAWAVLRGRAVAVQWPKPGELEDALNS